MDSPITHEKIIEVLRPVAEAKILLDGNWAVITREHRDAARDLYQRLQAEKEGGASETITAAAVQQEDGSVVSLPPPARHGDVLRHMHAFGEPPSSEKEQGFITSTGRFVDRYEAYRIAVRADQIIRAGDFQPQLYSEDLW